jgi:iron complex transport system substrate-binding protein
MVAMKKLLGLIAFFSLSLECIAQTCVAAKDPSRLSIAGGSLTEIVYLIGAEKQIVAVDVTSNYPPKARALPSIGYVRNLSTEGILWLDPTLVLGEDDMGPPKVLTQLDAMGVPIVIVRERHTMQSIIDKIRCIGNIIDQPESANRLIEQRILPRVAELQRLASDRRLAAKKILLVLSLQSGSPLVGGLETSANGVINMTGGRNAMTDVTGWKPASSESIIAAAPDFIVISRRGLGAFGELEDLRQHPALRLTPAALSGNIVVMDGMQMLGFGPRTLDAAVSLSRTFISPAP